MTSSIDARSLRPASVRRRGAWAISAVLAGFLTLGDFNCRILDVPTQYPIVLAHGFAGWSEDEGGGTYFYDVKLHLESLGYTVFTPAVSPVDGISVRAQQLEDAIVARFPTGKVNVIAHSMGGLDSRYMITHLGMADRVGALVTIATPHRGCVLSDMAVGDLPGVTPEIIAWILDFWGLDWGGVEDTTTAYLEGTFNPATPDMPQVAYHSYSGDGGPLLQMNPKFLLSYPLVFVNQGVNDGIVGVSSSQWGTDLGTLHADHFDEVGQPPNETEFDHLSMYTDLVRFLRDQGY